MQGVEAPQGDAGLSRPVALWRRYGVQGLLVAATLWFYVHSVWPRALHPGFDHNAWEAWALLHGHVFTPPPPARLDMMYYHGHWASFFPPLPAFLLIPLVWLLHGPGHTPVRLVCALVGAACPLLVYQMTRRAGLRAGVGLWLTALFGFGTVFWYAATWGTPWYFVQVLAVFFYLLCLRESFGPNRPALVGAWFGAALLCRNPIALGVPFLLWRERSWNWNRLLALAAPIAAAVAVQLWWNAARTGNPLDTGYAHILMNPYFRASFQEGMFSIRHLPYQLYSMFVAGPGFHSLPNFNGVWPYLALASTGQSLTLTTPAFIYTLEADLRRRGVWLAWVSVLLTALPQLFYYANGTGQFGNRFSLDYTPLLLALLIFGIGERFRWQHALLILVSIGLCGYGAVYAGGIHVLPFH